MQCLGWERIYQTRCDIQTHVETQNLTLGSDKGAIRGDRHRSKNHF